MQTNLQFGSDLAVKRWSPALYVEIKQQSYFAPRFISENDTNIIQQKNDLEGAAGDTVTYDLSARLRQQPTTGDNRLEGKEENLRFYSDRIKIDQLRHAVSAGGQMTRQRTEHDLRSSAKARLGEYMAQMFDELLFIYLSGTRGNNPDYIYPVGYVGHAGNPIEAPDNGHMMFGGDAKSKSELTAEAKMSCKVIERAVLKARTMKQKSPDAAAFPPVTIGGEEHYVCVMSPTQEYDMRTGDKAGWLDIQKAAAAAEGRKNPIFKGGLGMYNKVILHSHEKVISGTGGADDKLPTARALFLGRQAGAIAYGGNKRKGSTGKGTRFSWVEKIDDFDNEPKIAAGAIVGFKKTRFNDVDYATIAIDTAAATTDI
ncbi:MAG: hypothetical protein [Caudoviricetes sp.]|nr:MAG: hypothetical protein [Caudoviricetes sp.]